MPNYQISKNPISTMFSYISLKVHSVLFLFGIIKYDHIDGMLYILKYLFTPRLKTAYVYTIQFSRYLEACRSNLYRAWAPWVLVKMQFFCMEHLAKTFVSSDHRSNER